MEKRGYYGADRGFIQSDRGTLYDPKRRRNGRAGKEQADIMILRDFESNGLFLCHTNQFYIAEIVRSDLNTTQKGHIDVLPVQETMQEGITKTGGMIQVLGRKLKKRM